MNLENEITFWREESSAAKTKELALVAWGIYAGLRMAKDRLDETALAATKSEP